MPPGAHETGSLSAWHTVCDNRVAIEALYDSAEGLETIDLHEVVLHRDGPRLRLRFDLPRFPDRPPARWDRDANAVQAEVSFWSVEGVRLNGWNTEVKGPLLVEGGEDGFLLRFEGAGTQLTSRFSTARIDRFVAYQSDPPTS